MARAGVQASEVETQAEVLRPVVSLEQALAEEKVRSERLRTELAAARAAVAEGRSRNKALSRSLKALRSENKALLGSTSWRVTSPVRWSVERARGLARRLRRAVSGEAAPQDASAFFRDGFLAPVSLFTPSQCERILENWRRAPPAAREGWKTLAAEDRTFYELATHPKLLALLRPILGEDIVLWGATVIKRKPGQAHVWHTDIESAAPDGRFVSVWIGLANTSRGSGLRFVSRSHTFGKPVQQAAFDNGIARKQITDDKVLAWARRQDRRARLVEPEVGDGQALIFDGRLWHGSLNTTSRTRFALMFQYAAADMNIALPEEKHYDWPFKFSAAPPKTLLICGKSDAKTIVPPPKAKPANRRPIGTKVHLGDGFHASDTGWKPYPLFRGSTRNVPDMGCHVSVLNPGHSPHPPHAHAQEELLVVLRGEPEILIAESADPAGARIERLLPGSFVYYPAYQYHTLRNSSKAPVTYLMFKWTADPVEADHRLGTTVADIGGIDAPPSSKPRSVRVLFEAPTAYLGKLQAHVTDLQPGGGYAPHADKHDVGILVFSGTVETVGQTVGPGGSIFYAAGEPHGMRNVGDGPARYLVFEFHRSKARAAAV
jgi:uncharacterized cupin superfamily protein